MSDQKCKNCGGPIDPENYCWCAGEEMVFCGVPCHDAYCLNGSNF